MNNDRIDRLRHRVRECDDAEARATLSRYGKRGAKAKALYKCQREWVLDLLHAKKAEPINYDEPIMNQEGDMIPRYQGE